MDELEELDCELALWLDELLLELDDELELLTLSEMLDDVLVTLDSELVDCELNDKLLIELLERLDWLLLLDVALD